MIDAGDVGAGPTEAGDEAHPDGVAAGGGAPPPETITLTCLRTRSAASAGSPVVLTFRPTRFDPHLLAFDIARFLQALAERRDLLAQRSGRCGIAGCCARAASGHAAAPPMSMMNSRRL